MIDGPAMSGVDAYSTRPAFSEVNLLSGARLGFVALGACSRAPTTITDQGSDLGEVGDWGRRSWPSEAERLTRCDLYSFVGGRGFVQVRNWHNPERAPSTSMFRCQYQSGPGDASSPLGKPIAVPFKRSRYPTSIGSPWLGQSGFGQIGIATINQR